MDGIQDCVAVVTGAGSGIGRSTAVRFAVEGADVVVADVDVEGGTETATQVAEEGGESTFVETDVSDPAEVQALVESTVERFGRIDFVHNNAGIEGERAPTAEQRAETWDRVIDTNLKGVWLGMKYAIAEMLETPGGGTIVNSASTAGLEGSEQISPYVASKHGVVGLTRTAAREYGADGIRVNAICPGPVDTPMVQQHTEDDDSTEQIAADVPMGRMADPSEIASTVVWLCSDDASYVTGECVSIDGGRLA